MKNSIRKILREEVKHQNKELINEGVLDNLQKALTAIGIFFDPADGVNALISFARKDWIGAFANLLSMIPIVGSAVGLPIKGLLKIFTKAKLSEVFLKLTQDTGTAAAIALIQASANNPKTLSSVISKVKEHKNSIIKILNTIEEKTDAVIVKLPTKIKDSIPKDVLENIKNMPPNLKLFFNELATISNTKIEAEMAAAKETTA